MADRFARSNFGLFLIFQQNNPFLVRQCWAKGGYVDECFSFCFKTKQNRQNENVFGGKS